MQQRELPIAPPPPPRAPAAPPPPYTVKLCESSLGAHERIQAETRFCKALEGKLGTPEQVRDMLRQLQSAEEEGRELTQDEQALARRWQRAHIAARFVGLQDLAEITGAWFDVQAS